MRHLLNNKKTVAQLDQASAAGDRKDCVWDDVYLATRRFMDKETEKLMTVGSCI